MTMVKYGIAIAPESATAAGTSQMQTAQQMLLSLTMTSNISNNATVCHEPIQICPVPRKAIPRTVHRRDANTAQKRTTPLQYEYDGSGL